MSKLKIDKNYHGWLKPQFTFVRLKTLALATNNTIHCYGKYFIDGKHRVILDGTPQTTTFVSSTEIHCPITLNDNRRTLSVTDSDITYYFRSWDSSAGAVSTTYNPGKTAIVRVYLVIPGSGGGSGGMGTAGDHHGSGGGGGGRCTGFDPILCPYDATEFVTTLTAQSYALSVPAIVAGGAAVSTQNTNGNPGTGPNNTEGFGQYSECAQVGNAGQGTPSYAAMGGEMGGGNGGGYWGGTTHNATAGNYGDVTPGGTGGYGAGGGGGRNLDFLGPLRPGGNGGSLVDGPPGADCPLYVFGGGGGGGGGAYNTGYHSGKGGDGGPGLIYIWSFTDFT